MSKYKLVIIPLFGVIISQVIKFVIESIKYKKILVNRLLNGSGGLPSSHATLASSLTSLIYLDYGYSEYFAISLIFSLVILYDAVGVRYEVGKHARVLNELNSSSKPLKELIGHTLFEVLCGIILGIIISIIFNSFL